VTQLFFLLQSIAFYQIKHEFSKASTLAICCIVSTVSLLVLLTAFVITGELKYLHGRSMFCHSITMIVTFVGLALNYFTLLTPKSPQCYAIGKILRCCRVFLWFQHVRDLKILIFRLCLVLCIYELVFLVECDLLWLILDVLVRVQLFLNYFEIYAEFGKDHVCIF